MLQAGGLQHLRDAVEHAEHHPDPQLAPAEGEGLAAEQHEHDDRGDAEPHGEEVGRRHVLDEVVDQEERRAPHGRDGDEQERGEPGVPGLPGEGGHRRVRRSSG